MTEKDAAITHHALLIGVNYYPDESPSLKGCVRDVREIKEHLIKSRVGVAIQILTASLPDRESDCPPESPEQLATHGNVLASLESIITNASAGDFVYIHFSGHGTTITPLGSYSSRSTGDLSLALLHVGHKTSVRCLRGAELASRLKRMVDKKLLVTVVLDCCFSGSVMRNETVRCLPYNSSMESEVGSASRGASMRLNWMVNPSGYCVLAACGPAEEAKEAKFHDEHHGLLSYYLLEAFKRRGRVGGRLQHIYAHVRARFLKTYPQQNPMLYGNRRLCFFEDALDGFDAVTIPLFVVRDSSPAQRCLAAGTAHGVCVGDEFDLWSVDPTDHVLRAEQDPLIARVSRAGALRSVLEVVSPEPGGKLSSVMATARTFLLLRQYPVRLDLHVPCHEVWRNALAERPSLSVHFREDTISAAAFSLSVAIHDQKSYEIRDESNQIITGLPTAPYSLLENANFVLDIIHHLVRFKLVQDMSNLSPFGESIDVQLINKATDKSYRPGCLEAGPFLPRCSHPDCVIKANHGDVLELSLRNKGDPTRTLRVHAYAMGSSWEVENLLHGDHDVVPPWRSNQSKYFTNGTPGDWTKRIQMSVPQHLRDEGQLHCLDMIKIIVTLESVSFMSLELPDIGEVLTRYQKSLTRQPSPPDDSWAVLSFRIRTTIV